MTLGPQFRTVYHSSYSPAPPHKAQFGSYGIPIGDDGEEVDSVHHNFDPDTLFAGGLDAAQSIDFHDRRYLHTYRIPESSISTEMYGDDDLKNIAKDPDYLRPQYKRDEQPELFESIPVSGAEAARRGMVLQYRNMVEGGGEWHDPDSEDYLEVPKPSVVIPVKHMDKLGIQYMGVQDQRGEGNP